jgi:deoxyribodipyrimidine photolyase-related protein
MSNNNSINHVLRGTYDENTLAFWPSTHPKLSWFQSDFKNRRCYSFCRIYFSIELAEELRQQGYQVDYRFAETFSDGFAMHKSEYSSNEIIIHWPTDWTMRKLLDRWASDMLELPITHLDEDALFLVPRAEWPTYLSPIQSRWTMEHVYQKLRKKYNILMSGEKPLGGKWNYDTENRKRPNLANAIINPLHFPPDDITRQVIDHVSSNFPDHPGNISTFCWPVNRSQALAALDHFIHFRLPDFGEQQDAMIENQPFMAHSLLASAINIGLLQPLEVIQAAEKD